MNLPIKEDPRRRFQMAQLNNFAFRAPVVLGQHNGEWRATKKRGSEVRVLGRICDDSEITFAGAYTCRELASVSCLQIDTQAGIERKLHCAEDFDQPPINIRRPTHHNLPLYSSLTITGSQERPV
jgi:hypothetical protein